MSAPGSPREGMDRARAWVAARAGALEWVSIGILLPDPAALNQSRYLRLARTRGATVGFTEDLGELCRWKGALIVDRPTLAGLVAAEASTAAAERSALRNTRRLSSGCSTSRPRWCCPCPRCAV